MQLLNRTPDLYENKKKTMKIFAFLMTAGLAGLTGTSGKAQRVKAYPLKELLAQKQLDSYAKTLIPLDEDGKQGVACAGIVWLKGAQFSTGAIEVDLKGRDAFQKSFLGIVFHGVDTSRYDIVYFRPFNFRTGDSVRRIHAVQYCSDPEFGWERLRKERNARFEKAIDPPPAPEEWFHARIEVDGQGMVRVYVNHAKTPSLVVHKLNNRKDGLVGIWSSSRDAGDILGKFANLTITR